MINWYFIYAYAMGSAFLLSWCLTALIRRLALSWGVLDHPGERKMQRQPVPLLGGVAIYASFNIIIVANLLLLGPVQEFGYVWLEHHVFSFLGADVFWKLAGLTLGGFTIFILGLVDDLKALRPEVKLVFQILAAFCVTGGGIRLDLFLPGILGEGWLEWAVSSAATTFWIVMMTNAMNFLDNMDGLSAGVSAIAALSMFVSLMPQDTFVCALLAVLVGSVSGFLFHNLNPARIYMGDTGSMFCGYMLSSVAVLASFYTPGTPSRAAILAPLVALGVPIFDMLSVIYIRWRQGENIMKGDKRHFSHRLTDLGMTPRQAVEFIFLVAALNGLSAILLRQLNLHGALTVLAQTLGLFCLIVLLMNASRTHRSAPPNERQEQSENTAPGSS